MEAAENSSWYRNEGNGWKLSTPGLGETHTKGCLYKSGTLRHFSTLTFQTGTDFYSPESLELQNYNVC